MHPSTLNSTLNKAFVLPIGALLLWLPVSEKPGLARTQTGEVREGIPGRRIGGGTRIPSEACLTEPSSLIALMPTSNLGLTAEALPTLWFSLPAVNPSRQLEFGLFNQDDELVYQTTLNATGKAGVIGIDLSKMVAAPALKVNENYRWYLSIVCNSDNRSEDIWVDGWVQRVDLPTALTAQLAEASPLAQVQAYLDNQLWYEAVTQLAQLMQTQPTDATVVAEWQQLLASINLEQAAAAPILSPDAAFSRDQLATLTF
jgi:hypothetical protein